MCPKISFHSIIPNLPQSYHIIRVKSIHKGGDPMKKKNSLPRALIDPNKEADMLDMAKKLGSLPRDLQMYVAGAIDMAATMPEVKSDDTGQEQKGA